MENNKIYELLEKLKYNCHLGKHKHFAAAKRNKFYDNLFGALIILINLTIVFVHLFTINTEMPRWLVYSISGISMIAVLLVGLEFRYNFSKIFEAHRRIGNKYLNLARESEKYVAFMMSNIIENAKVLEIVNELNKQYNEINEEAESFPTNQNDYVSAKEIQESKLIK